MEQFKRFLGCGLGFPVQSNPDGGIGLTWHEENVEQNIRIIVGTAPGERQMRPDFGCRIHDLVFQPNNRVTANTAETFVQSAIAKWEPRVGDIEVLARPDPYADNLLRIEIRYTVRATNTSRNLVYPFYLQGQEGQE